MTILSIAVVFLMATGLLTFRKIMKKRNFRRHRAIETNVRAFNNRRRVAETMNKKIETRVAEKQSGLLSIEKAETDDGSLSFTEKREDTN